MALLKIAAFLRTNRRYCLYNRAFCAIVAAMMQTSKNTESEEVQITPKFSTNGAPTEPKRGRPATLTLELVQKIARLIAKGMTEDQACLRVGVNHATLRTAKHRNPEFETALKEAQAEYLDESLDVIGRGSKGWQGRAWILERRHGEQFRRNTAIELGGQVGLYSGPDRLVHKPLAQWTKSGFRPVSWRVAAFARVACRTTSRELHDRYDQVWGDASVLTDEQLEWSVEVSRRVAELRGHVTPGTSLREFTALMLGEAHIDATPTPLSVPALTIARPPENPEHF